MIKSICDGRVKSAYYLGRRQEKPTVHFIDHTNMVVVGIQLLTVRVIASQVPSNTAFNVPAQLTLDGQLREEDRHCIDVPHNQLMQALIFRNRVLRRRDVFFAPEPAPNDSAQSVGGVIWIKDSVIQTENVNQVFPMSLRQSGCLTHVVNEVRIVLLLTIRPQVNAG
jgi:hypothetical protein